LGSVGPGRRGSRSVAVSQSLPRFSIRRESTTPSRRPIGLRRGVPRSPIGGHPRNRSVCSNVPMRRHAGNDVGAGIFARAPGSGRSQEERSHSPGIARSSAAHAVAAACSMARILTGRRGRDSVDRPSRRGTGSDDPRDSSPPLRVPVQRSPRPHAGDADASETSPV